MSLTLKVFRKFMQLKLPGNDQIVLSRYYRKVVKLKSIGFFYLYKNHEFCDHKLLSRMWIGQ